MGIPLLEPRRGLTFDLAVDGADELDPQLRLIKGGGGVLLREKPSKPPRATCSSSPIPVSWCRGWAASPLPLEVVPFALPWVLDAVEKLGGAPVLRMQKDDPTAVYYSDQKNLLVDCHFQTIPDAEWPAAQLKTIPGIVEHGLFLGLARAAIIIQEGQAQVLRPGKAARPAAEFLELLQGWVVALRVRLTPGPLSEKERGSLTICSCATGSPSPFRRGGRG
ncbi:MAG: ribose-5-phosphate isomerase A [Hymenobacter sp.]